MSAPAGFWRRYAAYSLDLTLLGMGWLALSRSALQRAWQIFNADLAMAQDRVLALLGDALTDPVSPLALAASGSSDPALQATITTMSEHLSAALIPVTALAIALSALYFIGFEASPWQATPGKRCLHLRVTTQDGYRPSLGRTVLRFAAGGLSWLSFNLGHALAAWTPRKQALHDLIAGTIVERDAGISWPLLARVWLALQALAMGLALAWLITLYVQALNVMMTGAY